jgi:hypothetical protein
LFGPFPLRLQTTAGFLGVMSSTQAAQVIEIPKQNRIAAMRHDVIDLGRGDGAAFA